MVWEKGSSGNPEGIKPNKPFIDALRRAIVQDNGKKLRAAADKLLDAAEAGEPWAIKELADRTDGKPHQTTDTNVSGELGIREIVRSVIDPKGN